MKKVIPIIIAVILIIAILFNARTIGAATHNILYQSPCDTPKGYRLGSIDPQFTLSAEEHKAAIAEAADIWSNAYGKPIFVYNPQAEMAINFIYDERQALNSAISHQNETLKEKSSSLEPEIAAYEKKAADLRIKIDSLNKEIESWNEKGGAPPEEYKRLTEQQQQYQKEADALNAEARSLSLETEEFNTEVHKLDENVDSYNNALVARPEGGEYIRDASGEKIDIYIYSTHQDLINILAHELGHAIGMEHVNDSDAIMYYKTNDSSSPTADDLIMLTTACQKQNIVKTKFIEFSYSIKKFVQKFQSKNTEE